MVIRILVTSILIFQSCAARYSIPIESNPPNLFFDSLFRSDTTKMYLFLGGNHFHKETNRVTLDLLKRVADKGKCDVYLEASNSNIYYFKEFYGKYPNTVVNSFLNYGLFYNDSIANSFNSFIHDRNINLFGFDCTRFTKSSLEEVSKALKRIYTESELPISKNEFNNFLIEINRSYGYGHRLVVLTSKEKEFLIYCFSNLLDDLVKLKETILVENITDLYNFYSWIFERKPYYDYEDSICEKSLKFESYRDRIMFNNLKTRFNVRQKLDPHSKAIVDVGAFHFFGDGKENNKNTFVERLINYYGREKIKTFCFIPKSQITIPSKLKKKLIKGSGYDLLASDLCKDLENTQFQMLTLCKDNQFYTWLKKYDFIFII